MGGYLEGQFDRYRLRGDLRALERVFDRTARELLGLAQHLVRNVDDAEDLVQATFVTAIDRASSYDRSRPLRPWLSGILARQAANLLRSRGRRAGTDDGLAGIPGQEPDPAQHVQELELDSALNLALERLSPPYREVLRAYLVAGDRPEEIARRLERAPGTVRAQIHRGLERLRRGLPAGVGAGLLVGSARGLPAVRSSVLQHGALAAATGAVPAATLASGLTIGAIMLGKKTVLIGAGALLATTGFWLVEAPSRNPLVPDLPGIVRHEAGPTALAAERGRELSGVEAQAAPANSQVRTPVTRGRALVRGRLHGVLEQHLSELKFDLTLRDDERSPPSSSARLLAHLHKSDTQIPFGLLESAQASPTPALAFDGIAVRDDGTFELELTSVLTEAEFEGELNLQLRVTHELYFDDTCTLTFTGGDRRRINDREQVLRNVELSPRPAAILRGVARRSSETEAGFNVNFHQVTRNDLGDDVPSSTMFEWSAATSVLSLVGNDGSRDTAMAPGQFVVVALLAANPIELALVRPGAEEPLSNLRADYNGEFEFKIEQGGPFLLVALTQGRPPRVLPVDLELASALELEEPLEIDPGPTLEGVVEHHGAFPGGGLGLEAVRLVHPDDEPLSWGDHPLAWHGGVPVRTLVSVDSAGDNTFKFEGLSPGAHLVGLGAGASDLFDEASIESMQVEAPVPSSGLQLEVPIAVLEVSATFSGSVPDETRDTLRLEVFELDSDVPLGAIELDQNGRADLLVRPGQQLTLKVTADGWHFPAHELTAPGAGQRGQITVEGKPSSEPSSDDR
jgi:RNA polymerase sigma factor (sigma-70 family)